MAEAEDDYSNAGGMSYARRGRRGGNNRDGMSYARREQRRDSMGRYSRESGYSYSPPVASNVVSYTSGTEFSQAIDGKDINKVLATADEAFDAVRTFAPHIYDVIIEKFFEIS